MSAVGISDCSVCMEEGKGSVILTRAMRGPSPGSPGEPPEYEFVCYRCQGKEDDDLYAYDESREEEWWPEVAS